MAAPSRSPRRRDRHGRGLRGPLAPPSVPLTVSPAERFDDLVVTAVARAGRRMRDELGGLGDLEVVVTELPAGHHPTDSGLPVPLGTAHPATPDRPARVVVHRRPLEARAATRRELQRLVRDVVAEQLSVLLGVPPDEIDPGWTRR